ncbi:MAG TPA: DinB family protein [Vicinamibacteria bacterium]|nr:DinB family protein [Vicinamibacteria bacterium]
MPGPALDATRASGSSFPSVGATLAHIVEAEWIWQRRWLGASLPAPAWVARADLAELEVQRAAIERERGSYLASLSDTDLDQTVSYQNLAGKAFTNRLSDLVRHVVNHSTYHRGQVATQLRQLGHTPPNTDLIAFLRRTGWRRDLRRAGLRYHPSTGSTRRGRERS